MAETESAVPHGDSLRKAIVWISARRQEDPSRPLWKLIEEASVRYDLSPADAEFLTSNLAGP